jgi:transcriptional regulator with XRE-family HTH domain
MNDDERRAMLGTFLRAHRERLAPPRNGGRRRTPGLRREELADAAGLSITWITWLEQGREVKASVGALCRLAEALQLSGAERASMFDLAGEKDPEAGAWTARAWNTQAADLFTGWLDAGAQDRNLLRYVFLHPAARTLIADWEHRARRLAAEFRADFHRHPGDAALKALVDGLCAGSALFADCWRRQDVLHREGGERRFVHPEQGRLAFAQTTLLVAAQRDVKLVCLSPA